MGDVLLDIYTGSLDPRIVSQFLRDVAIKSDDVFFRPITISFNKGETIQLVQSTGVLIQ